MPRPRKNRRVGRQPMAVFYKPQGVALHQLKGLVLSVEGLEAVRLADAERLEHQHAAEMMGISRPTFSRVLTEARQTIATALVNAWAIRIEGGSYEITPQHEIDFTRRRRHHGGRQRFMRKNELPTHNTYHKEVIMPNKDGTGPDGKGQRSRTPGPRQGQRRGSGQAQNSPGGRRSGKGMGPGQRQNQGKKWQRYENQ
jgi:predicted DNA-binding protein (UPF0251 family)